ncbi:MAG: tRNA (adenosine(37)-N6)-dimethylallyltransferase MiaA [Chitinispirillaceae bacterium]|nr:tRNA (adenosine(37)-N6)-dimethylallyltransferase MiaA [Chitinispirillaceae bacterium]
MKKLIVICGPTATGKTALGVRLAVSYNGEIISCDSRQVYRGMDIGTGKDLSHYRVGTRDIPYHLIDIADPAQVYTVYHYQRDFYRVFAGICSRNRVPVVVGGTGLYLEAVLRSFRISAIPEDGALRELLMSRDKHSLEQELKQLDPKRYAETDLSSKKRIVRSLEVAYARQTGSGDSDRRAIPLPPLDPIVIGVRFERSVLRERIRLRLEERFDQGMVDEVRRLLSSGIPPQRFDMFGLEYKHIARYIRGEIEFDAMKQELFHAICRFAKRQETWFRGMERRGIPVHWIKEDNAEKAEQYVAQFLKKHADSTIQPC